MVSSAAAFHISAADISMPIVIKVCSATKNSHNTNGTRKMGLHLLKVEVLTCNPENHRNVFSLFAPVSEDCVNQKLRLC